MLAESDHIYICTLLWRCCLIYTSEGGGTIGYYLYQGRWDKNVVPTITHDIWASLVGCVADSMHISRTNSWGWGNLRFIYHLVHMCPILVILSLFLIFDLSLADCRCHIWVPLLELFTSLWNLLWAFTIALTSFHQYLCKVMPRILMYFFVLQFSLMPILLIILCILQTYAVISKASNSVNQVSLHFTTNTLC